jgi:hypothetical protein
MKIIEYIYTHSKEEHRYMQDIRSQVFSHLAVVFTVLFWGMSFVSTKIILNTGFPPVTIALIRFIIAGCILATIPVFTLIAERFFFNHRMRLYQAGAILFSIIGVYFLINPDGMAVSDTGSLHGNLFMLGACISWASYIIISKKLHVHYSGLAMSTYHSLFGALFLILLALLERNAWVRIDMFGMDAHPLSEHYLLCCSIFSPSLRPLAARTHGCFFLHKSHSCDRSDRRCVDSWRTSSPRTDFRSLCGDHRCNLCKSTVSSPFMTLV